MAVAVLPGGSGASAVGIALAGPAVEVAQEVGVVVGPEGPRRSAARARRGCLRTPEQAPARLDEAHGEVDREGHHHDEENQLAHAPIVVRRGNPATHPIRTAHTTNAGSRLAEYYDDTSVGLVREIYRDDFKLLGYGFDLGLA